MIMKPRRIFVAGLLLSVIPIALILWLHLFKTHWLIHRPSRNSTPSQTCGCTPKSEITLDKSSKQRRYVELQDWRRLHASSEEPLAQCKSFSPFQYIGSGITVQPLGSTKLYGLALNRAASKMLSDVHNVSQIQLYCRNALGVLHISKTNYLRSSTGNNTRYLTLNVDAEVDKTNEVLSEVRYRSTIYNVQSREIIDITWMSYNVSIHLHIKRPERPFLYDQGESRDINAKVTVVTKTFERYPAVKRLISSVHNFYPNITILVADDSEFPEKIRVTNVKQYIMPFAEGWFAGRNLVVSQVRTKYFLWVDDDFVFTNGTRLETFVEKFEHPNVTVDYIGGTFGDEFGKANQISNCYGCRRLEYQPGDEEGDCLAIRKWKHYHQVAEFPQCFWADGTDNFFMARTSSVRKVGFDPFFERVGHFEYFIDSLGTMRMMGCTDVNIMHKSDRSNPKYNKFRGNNAEAEKLKHVSFKNNLRCLSY